MVFYLGFVGFNRDFRRTYSAEHGQEADRSTWGIIESNFLSQAAKTDEKDTKFRKEVSHSY
jgi:hypothetical protein